MTTDRRTSRCAAGLWVLRDLMSVHSRRPFSRPLVPSLAVGSACTACPTGFEPCRNRLIVARTTKRKRFRELRQRDSPNKQETARRIFIRRAVLFFESGQQDLNCFRNRSSDDTCRNTADVLTRFRLVQEILTRVSKLRRPMHRQQSAIKWLPETG